MKKVDITKSVMETVATYERKRSNAWVLQFRLVIGILLLLTGAFLWRVYLQLQERGTLDLLALLGEDAEIIQEFWQDTVIVFLAELPQDGVVVASILLLVLCVVVWQTRKKRKITNRRLTELAKRMKN
jgi:hypothetical protein